MITVVTGKLGGGKTLTGVWLCTCALRAGRVIATNIDLHVDRIAQDFKLRPEWLQSRIHVADPAHLELIPHGDSRASAHQRRVVCVVDEAADWFASDDMGGSVKAVRNWLRHTDKVGIDVYLIIQDIRLLNRAGRMLAQRNLDVVDFARIKFAVLGCNPFFWTWGFVRVTEIDMINQCSGEAFWLRKSEIGRYYDTAQLYAGAGEIARAAGSAYDTVDESAGSTASAGSSFLRYICLGSVLGSLGGLLCARLMC